MHGSCKAATFKPGMVMSESQIPLVLNEPDRLTCCSKFKTDSRAERPGTPDESDDAASPLDTSSALKDGIFSIVSEQKVEWKSA